MNQEVILLSLNETWAQAVILGWAQALCCLVSMCLRGRWRLVVTAPPAQRAEVVLPPARGPLPRLAHMSQLRSAHCQARSEAFLALLTSHPSFQDCPPPYFSSSQRLVGSQCRASRLESAAAENPGVQVMAGSLMGAGGEW